MPPKNRANHNMLIYLSLAGLLLLFALFYTNRFILKENHHRITRNFEKALHDKESIADQYIYNLENEILNNDFDSTFYNEDQISLLNENGIVLLIYQNERLTYWSNNSIPVFDYYKSNEFSNNFEFHGNGWHEVRTRTFSNFILIGLIKIKNEYDFENEYLRNEFHKDFNIPDEVQITFNKDTDFRIYDKENTYLFSLSYPAKFKPYESDIVFLTVIYLFVFIFIIVATYNAYVKINKYFKWKWLLLIGFIIDILILRLLIFYFEIPTILYTSKLFSPALFANSFLLPSLGDFLVNAIVIFAISFVVHKSINTQRINYVYNRYKNVLLFSFLIIILFLLFLGLTYLLDSLIIDSNLSYNLNTISSINQYSIIGFFIFGLVILSFVFLTFKISLIITKFTESTKKFLFITALIHIVLFVICFYLLNCNSIFLIFQFIYILSYWIIKKSDTANIKFSSTVFFIMFFSIYSTYILYRCNLFTERESRKIVAHKLAEDKDPELEYIFSVINSNVKSDSTLNQLIDDHMYNFHDNSLEIKLHLEKNHFTSYWKKYDLLFTICDSARILDIQPENYLINCYDYFQAKIKDYGLRTDCENLYYLKTESGNEKYLGILDFSNSDFSLKIFIEVFSKNIPKGLGYPELLIDAGVKKSADWSKYSWAKYENGKLIYRFGKYFYSINISNYGNDFDPDGFFNRNGYNHFYYQTNDNTVLILSKKNPGLLDIVAPFSYIFIFYGILVFLIFLILRSPIEIKLFEFNFRQRLQLFITALILISFFFVGIGSLFYIISLHNNKNNDILSEKTHSVLIELEHKIADMEDLSPEMEPYLTGLLYKFSLVFFSDINLYNLEGTLLATSRPEIFNKGLISNKMNSMAFNYMSNYKKTLFIHNESIGEYNYLSAYLPFRNEENNLIAYLNLPYFAKQDELTNEISTYLVAFINIYVILIAFAIFIALIMSNYITKPLQLIKDKISRLKLGRTNERIEWSKKDEIGSLVDEYNRMVDELANSAELLAKSERESAWREMAKQIAHEIKNQLTPMKLSVQYLQKAYDEKVPDWDKRLKRFTKTIVEQIESLSIIASEFSDFAKMPKSKFAKTEIIEVIKNSIGLFKNATQIKIELYYSDNHYVLADREQLLRVFNNLIKNALQAIINPAKGLIEITVEQEMELVVITFKDNGKGIPKAQREKVFYPNFTTKSGGMGLGLAMVKNIIQNAGGEITFESEENVGTTFIVALPVYNPDSIQ